MLLTRNDVSWLGHHFKAISHFIYTVSMGQQDQFILLKASDKTHNTHKDVRERCVVVNNMA